MEASTTTGRTLVATTNPGWYLNADDPDGSRLRKKDGDTVISREQFEIRKKGQAMGTDASQAEATQATREKAQAEAANGNGGNTKPKAERKPPKETTSTTGKKLIGETVEIRCAYVPEDKRNKAQAKLFNKFANGDKKALTYDKVLAAADQGDDKGGKPDGRKRVIKKQDEFQVRFHPDNQALWRNELRRRANAAKPKKAAAAKS